MAKKKMYISITKANDEIRRLRRSNNTKRSELKSIPMEEAVKGFAAVSAGAALIGAVRAKTGDKFVGVPVEPLAAAIAATAGYMGEMPMLVSAASGMLAPYLADMTEDMMQPKPS